MGIWRLWWETAKGIFTTAPSEHLSMLKQDSGFALRMMRKNLGFTIAAIIVLGLGIGANTAIFSVVNAVLLKPLPFEHGERLLMLNQRTRTAGAGVGRSSVPELNDYRAQSRSMDGIVEYHNMQFILLGRSEPERVETGVVSWNFFDVFGVKPLAGRMFEPNDEKPGAPAVLLLSYEYWLRSFGGDPTVVGKTFRMNDKPHLVIGILPPFPQYPHENDVYMTSSACPFRSDPETDRRSQGTHVAAVWPHEAWRDTRAGASRSLDRRGNDAARISERLLERRYAEDGSHSDENGADARRQADDAVPAGCRGIRAADRLRQRRQSQSCAHGAPRT